MENIIGRKVRGFEFENINGLSYVEGHKECLGKIGAITPSASKTYARVQFDNDWNFYPLDQIKEHLVDEVPTHYDNTNGSIYKFCNDQKLNAWEFDIIKRIVRSRKKGMFKEDLEKTKVLIDLYLKEFDNE